MTEPDPDKTRSSPETVWRLLTLRRFLPLFVTQFLGALNDNVYKNALVTALAFGVLSQAAYAEALIIWAGACFILPYVLFSSLAGEIADRVDKATIMRHTKLLEIVIMGVGAVGFLTGSVAVLYLMLFLMGAQSTFFSPCKYGILPDHLAPRELVGGNALIAGATFLAILLGTIGGTQLVLLDAGPSLVAAGALALAIVGYLASRAIPPAPPPRPDLRLTWNIVSASWRIVRQALANTDIRVAILGDCWFWFLGAAMLALLPLYVRDTLGVDADVYTIFLALFSVGIGAGSILSSRVLRGRISARYVPLAALGMAVFVADLAFGARDFSPSGPGAADFATFAATFDGWRIMAGVFLVALFAGFYEVPLFAIIQHHAETAWRGRTIAANNILNSFVMVLSSVAVQAGFAAGLSIPDIFLAFAGLCVAAALLISARTSDSVLRRAGGPSGRT